jgi:DNA-binding SARP family transcriptional activator
VLGPFRVLQAGQPVAVHGAKTEALLCHLALRYAEGITRAVLLETLWPDSDAALAGDALRNRVHSLHTLLGAGLGGAAPVLLLDGGLRLNAAAGVGVDVAGFDALAARGDQQMRAGHAVEAAAAYQHAAAFYRGDLCVAPDLYAVVERERLRARYLSLLAALAALAHAAGDDVACLAYAQRGAYDQAEMVIQHLLAEAGLDGFDPALVSVDARGIEAPAEWSSLEAPETYLGYERAENFASPGGAVLAQPHVYAAPARLRRNQWSLEGEWTIEPQAAVLNTANGRITYRFHARDLHLVLAPAAGGSSVRFRVLLDEQAPGAAHGLDVDEEGHGTVTAPRLYQLIRQPQPIADRQFEITFLDAGVEVFVFTFG